LEGVLVLLTASEDVGTASLIADAAGLTGSVQRLSVLGVALLLLLEILGLGWYTPRFLLNLNFGGHNKWIL